MRSWLAVSALRRASRSRPSPKNRCRAPAELPPRSISTRGCCAVPPSAAPLTQPRFLGRVACFLRPVSRVHPLDPTDVAPWFPCWSFPRGALVLPPRFRRGKDRFLSIQSQRSDITIPQAYSAANANGRELFERG